VNALRARRANPLLLLPRAAGSTKPHFAHDFSRILVDAPAAGARQAIQETAEAGTEGSAGWFPHLAAIQRSFGRHDVSRLRAHQGAGAHAAANVIGASAYTLGDRVAFSGPPDLHTAAHEAAHVIQQRVGIKVPGGLGEAGDLHERHADAVADRVVRGQSSEDLLHAHASGGGVWPGTAAPGKLNSGRAAASGNAVQMKKLPTAFGTFEDVYYHAIANAKDEEIGCEMYLRFTPGDTVDASKIALTQVLKPTKEGSLDAADETKKKQTVTSGAGKDFYVDRLSSSRNPLYGASVGAEADKDKLAGWNIGPKVTPMAEADKKAYADAGMKGVKYSAASKGQSGYRKKSGADWISQPAELDDWPVRPDSVGKKNSGQYFETTALAVDGAQKDSYYGSVQWGWERDAKAVFNLVDFKVVSMGTPSAKFMAAAEKWNTSKTSGGEATIKLPTVEVYTTSKEMDVLAGKDKIKLASGTRVQVISKGATAKDPWQVKIVDGPNVGKQVSVDGATVTKE
jgi:Domain of unknown function (DUF4157)